MKMSLLEMTQSILSAMDSDPVDDISETVESLQVAELIREAYFDLMSLRDWGHLRSEFELVGLGDVLNPTRMQIPELVNKVFWIKYNKKDTCFMEPKLFRDMLDRRTVEPNVVDANGFGLDRDPAYWTSFDDDYIVFDSRDQTVDNTLQQVKSLAYGVESPVWTHTNTAVPKIPEKYFPTLLAEAKAQAFINLKQQANNREEMKARRGRVTMQNEHWRNDRAEPKFNTKVNYGRR